MDTYPLLTHASGTDPMAWRHGRPVTVDRFLRDVATLAAALPPGRHVLNACADRYRFTVGLAAALVSGRISLLPPSHTAEIVRQMRQFAPDAFCLADQPNAIDLPQIRFQDLAGDDPGDGGDGDHAAQPIPQIAADRTMAWVFTSGSTGLPVPHRKTWGHLVRDVRAERAALMLPDDSAPHVLGTVPPQHMYGIESTVLMPLQSGGTLSAAHPLYPADICAALAQLARPRVLVTTPLHLRALLDGGVEIPAVDLVLSATAALSGALAVAAEQRLGVPLQEIYGSTETGQIATRRTTATEHWTLLPGIRLEQRGEQFWACGGHVEPETPLGDALELRHDGSFLMQGRIGDLVNIAGKRNSLAYLNHQLLAIAGVQDGVFYMRPPESLEGATRLAAFVVAPDLDRAVLLAALRQRIDPVFMPRPLVLLGTIPRNSTGKVTRETIETLARTHLQRDRRHGDAQDGS